MIYTIITLRGFVTDPATGGIKQFATAEEAMAEMKPRDQIQIIPIREKDLPAYQSGQLRPPIFNRSGIRDR